MKKKLPTGIQGICEILGDGYVYVDKTKHAQHLINQFKHCFISRPRRFGKSLFLDTLKEIFLRNKELFKECAIYKSDYAWKKHPVIYFDFAKLSSLNPEALKNDLVVTLRRLMATHGISFNEPEASAQLHLNVLIEELAKKEGSVVVLVDEYDKPIIDRLHDLDLAFANRDILQGFFGTLKSLDKHLRFTFTTGISKFSQVTLFSGFNNLKDLTMNPDYADMMGYTEKDIEESFGEHIEAFLHEKKHMTRQGVLEEVRTWYNGYRFSEKELTVFNPFSTLNYFQDQRAEGYWYSSGTPTFLIHQLKKHSQSMISLDGAKETKEQLLDISELEQINLSALMYQAGYFTIQGYNPLSKRYDLGFPNEEVRSAFINSLVQHFATIPNLRASKETIRALENYEVDIVFKTIEQGFASFAYQVFVDAKERTYQGMLLAMLYGMGCDPLSEMPTNTGRIDVVLEVPSVTYIMELKLDGKADSALKQIREKNYHKPCMHKDKHIILLGANFSSKERNISDWRGELLSPSGETLKTLSPTQ
ncbi:MAG: AAA family ATPase [Chlamydiia bacterium]|nr:AAA family ATPase [Chlamydiia bacterium]